MIIKYKPGDKVQALKATQSGWKGRGIVLEASPIIVTIAMMDGPHLGQSAIYLPQELKPIKDQ